MSNNNLYREIYDIHQNFFESYINRLLIKNNDSKFAECRLSYINYLTDVNNNL
jgi:hypothetical protein